MKLGARSAVGIDIDPDALDNARENAGLNQMGDRVRFEEGDFREMAVGADVVMANLTGGLLERSAEALAAMVAPDGFLIVSGFMDSEKAAVVPALERFLTLRTMCAGRGMDVRGLYENDLKVGTTSPAAPIPPSSSTQPALR